MRNKKIIILIVLSLITVNLTGCKLKEFSDELDKKTINTVKTVINKTNNIDDTFKNVKNNNDIKLNEEIEEIKETKEAEEIEEIENNITVKDIFFIDEENLMSVEDMKKLNNNDKDYNKKITSDDGNSENLHAQDETLNKLFNQRKYIRSEEENKKIKEALNTSFPFGSGANIYLSKEFDLSSIAATRNFIQYPDTYDSNTIEIIEIEGFKCIKILANNLDCTDNVYEVYFLLGMEYGDGVINVPSNEARPIFVTAKNIESNERILFKLNYKNKESITSSGV